MTERADTWAILTDTTRCTGCEKCVQACKDVQASKSENGLVKKDVPRRWKRRIDDLSSTRYTTILRRRENEESQFVRQQCRHCLDPACVSACLVGALQQAKDSEEQPIGPVIYDPSKCMGCRYCMVACPYGIPRYDWEKPVPEVRKCNMCYERIMDSTLEDKDRKPACVLNCPQEATIFGDRDELVTIAWDRIRENPGKYVNKVYGETEVGGTSVLYISDISLDFLSFNQELKDDKLPDLTWAALSKVPPLVVGVGGVMAGVWWMIGRRMKLAEETARSAMTAEETQQGPSEPAQRSEENQEK